MTLKIYHGVPKPIRAVGIHQCRILRFAEKFRSWHAIGRGQGSKRAVAALANRGCLEVKNGWYRFKYPE